MSDSSLLKASKNLISELTKAVGEENVESVAYNISASSQPQFYTLSLLSNGFPSIFKRTFKKLNNCGIIFPPDFKFPVKKNWMITSNSQPLNVYQNNFFSYQNNSFNNKNHNEISIFDDILTHIHNFLEIRVNNYQPIDILKQITQNNIYIPPDLFARFIDENDWHAGLKPLDVFEAIEDPDTKGDLSNVVKFSYTKVNYKKGYPRCSGKRPSETLLHNFDWLSCEQDIQDDAKSKTANIPQVTELMENIEDDSNDLDVQITQNKNVLRMLLFGGPLCSSFSPIVAEELNRIYPGKGGLIVELLHVEPDSIYPIILKRLRERCKELYFKKISDSSRWCKQLENALPIQRTIFRKDLARKIKPKEMTSIIGERIQYPIDKVPFLTIFYQYAKINMHIEPKYPNLEERMNVCIRNIVNELRNPQIRDIKVTYAHSICIYLAAFFLKQSVEMNIIDDIKSSSVQTAIDIGITDVKEHGYQRLLTVIGDSINNRKKVKKVGYQPIVNCILETSGLIFDIDLEQSANLIQTAQLFFKVLRNYAIEDDSEASFITCKLENGNITLLSLDSIVQINL